MSNEIYVSIAEYIYRLIDQRTEMRNTKQSSLFVFHKTRGIFKRQQGTLPLKKEILLDIIV